MAVRYAVATGNWSAVGTWDGGASLPTVGDDVYANGYTVTVNQDITVAKISTEVCPTTSVGGGLFQTTDASQTYIIAANVVAGTSACLFNYQCTLYIIGNIYGGSGTNAYGTFYRNSTYHITGNIYGGTGTGARGVSSISSAYYVAFNMVGNVFANTGGEGIIINGYSSSINIIGNLYANGSVAMIYTASSSIIIGNLYASVTNPCVISNSTLKVTGNLINVNGVMAVSGSKLYLEQTSMFWTFQNFDGTDYNLYTQDTLENPPSETDVRSGVVYGIGNNYEGKAYIPPRESVVKNVPVDNTVGTWAFDTELITRLQQCSTVPITGQQIASYNGAPAELIPYNEKRTDYVLGSPDILYLGTAPVGTLDASPVWNLTKLELAIDGSISSETHSTDSWDNHLTAIYS